MAKRAPSGDTPYNPLDTTLARSVIIGTAETQRTADAASGGSSGGNAETRMLVRRPASNDNVLDLPSGENPSSASRTAKARNLSREKRVLLTPEEERQIERLVVRIGEHLGTSLKLSHLLRACMVVLCHAEEETLHRAMEMGLLPRPANGDAIALVHFEQSLAKLLSSALRDAPPIR